MVSWVGAGLVGFAIAHGGPIEPCVLDGSEPSAWVLTFSPGDTTETVFGHTAILAWDPDQGGWSQVYDYGRYTVESRLQGVVAVLTATQEYYLATRTLDETKDRYRERERSVVGQRLALTDRQRRELIDALATDLNDDPTFAYNWYRPNCTTKVEELVDEVLDGALAPQHQDPSGWSPARQVLRHSADLWPLWFGLHWGSGRVADNEVTTWDAAFLPETLMALFADSHTGDGTPLVAETCVLVDAGSAPVRAAAPNRDLLLWGLGLVWGAGLAGLSTWRRRAGLVAVAAQGLAVGVFGGAALAVGLLGTFAPFWGHHNQFFAHLGHLALPVAAAWAARAPRHRGPAVVAAVLLVIALVGIVWTAITGFAERNLGIVGLLVPSLVAALWALRPTRS